MGVGAALGGASTAFGTSALSASALGGATLARYTLDVNLEIRFITLNKRVGSLEIAFETIEVKKRKTLTEA